MSYQKIGFTGTRKGMTDEQAESVEQLLVEQRPQVVHHGVCIGADEEFDQLAVAAAIKREGHPAYLLGHAMRSRWLCEVMHDIRLPLDRNRDIVDAVEMLIATPETAKEERRSGTWYTVRYARMRSKPIALVLPDGSVQWENTT